MNPVVRARDVRPKLKEMGFERGVAHLIELMCEELSAQRQMIEELGKSVTATVQMVDRMADVALGHKTVLEKLVGMQASEGDDAPHATDQH